MAKSFKILTSKMSKEAIKKSDEKYAAMKKAMPLHELRIAMQLSQERLVELFDKKYK